MSELMNGRFKRMVVEWILLRAAVQ